MKNLFFIFGLMHLSNCIAFAKDIDSLSYQDKFNVAVKSYQEKRYKSAEMTFRSILSNHKNYRDPASQLMLSKSQYQLGLLDKAFQSSKSLLSAYPNSPYESDILVLLGDISLTKGNFTKAYRYYLKARSNIRDSMYLNHIDERIYNCIGLGLKEENIESLLFREKNPVNRSIINLSRSYQVWINGDYYSLNQVVDEIDTTYLPKVFFTLYNKLDTLKKNDIISSVTFAVLLPLTGLEQDKGLSYLLGLIEYLNSPKLSKAIRFLIYDTAGRVENTLKIINEISLNLKIAAVLGPITKDEVLSISGMTLNMPILIPKSELSGLSDISNNLFFLSPSSQTIAQRTAQMIIKELNLKKIAVLSPGNGSIKLLTDYFIKECHQLGVDPVITEWYIEKPENLSRQLNNIRKMAWTLVPEKESKNLSLNLEIDSLDALFDVDVSDFFELPPEKEDDMDKKDSAKIVLETIEAIYIPIRPGELTYVGTQFPFYNLNTLIFANDNWLDIPLLNQEVIGPHVEGMKIISDVNSEKINGNQDFFSNYYSLAIDHTTFIQSIINQGISKRKHFIDELRKNYGFDGERISIGFGGLNNNENGIAQVLEYSNKSITKIGIYDGETFSRKGK